MAANYVVPRDEKFVGSVLLVLALVFGYEAATGTIGLEMSFAGLIVAIATTGFVLGVLVEWSLLSGLAVSFEGVVEFLGVMIVVHYSSMHGCEIGLLALVGAAPGCALRVWRRRMARQAEQEARAWSRAIEPANPAVEAMLCGD